MLLIPLVRLQSIFFAFGSPRNLEFELDNLFIYMKLRKDTCRYALSHSFVRLSTFVLNF